jgi:hypothetical protein
VEVRAIVLSGGSSPAANAAAWEKHVLSARGVQAGREALIIHHINAMEVRN